MLGNGRWKHEGNAELAVPCQLGVILALVLPTNSHVMYRIMAFKLVPSI